VASITRVGPHRLLRRLTRRQRLSTLLLSVVAIGFITLDLGGSGLESAHTGVRGSFGALYRGTDSVLGPARRWLQGLPSAGSNEAKLDDLRAANEQLRGQLSAAEQQRSDARQLARLGSITAVQADGASVLAARVVAIGAGEGFDWTVTLDKGSADGLAAGQTVTDGAGLVGRVLHADKTSAVVLLAADPGSGVGARDSRNGEIGISTGAGMDGFTFRPLNPDAKLKVGDQLSTGPSQDSSYLAGLAIGTITSVTTSTDGTVTAHVKPVSSPTSLDVLGVVVPAAPPDSAATDPAAGVTPR
jgi:rod shape-determining protein MreC